MRYSMESLIHHFKFIQRVFPAKKLFIFSSRGPKGEFGIFISSDGSAKPIDVK
jgi:NADH:ubiquinone oxidoreductase subunit D